MTLSWKLRGQGWMCVPPPPPGRSLTVSVSCFFSPSSVGMKLLHWAILTQRFNSNECKDYFCAVLPQTFGEYVLIFFSGFKNIMSAESLNREYTEFNVPTPHPLPYIPHY